MWPVLVVFIVLTLPFIFGALHLVFSEVGQDRPTRAAKVRARNKQHRAELKRVREYHEADKVEWARERELLITELTAYRMGLPFPSIEQHEFEYQKTIKQIEEELSGTKE